jgi:hypothetical protein
MMCNKRKKCEYFDEEAACCKGLQHESEMYYGCGE